MGSRVSYALRNFLIGAVLGLLLVLAIGGVAFFLLRGVGARSQGPTVIIRSPQFGQQVNAQETALVHAMAEDLRGVTRVELWVDERLHSVQTSQLPQGSNPFPLTYPWFPEDEGYHVLVVRAYNRAGGTGQATVLVEAIPNPGTASQTSHEVARGDTIAGIAATHGLTVEEVSAQNPGLTEPLTVGQEISLSLPTTAPEGAPSAEPVAPEPLPGEEPPDPLVAHAGTPLDRLASLLPVGRTPTGTWVEIEVLSLEVDKDYDGVYCYYSLAGGPFERVPADGYLEDSGDRRWGIDAAMGGDRRRVVLLSEGSSTLDLRGNCMGYRSSAGGGEVFDLGTLAVTHTLAEADGTPIIKEIIGRDGWFRVGYQMHVIPTAPGGTPPRPSVGEEPPAGTLPAPSLSGTCDRGYVEDRAADRVDWRVECQLVWTVPTDSRGVSPWVDGFLLLRNGAIVESLPARGPWRKTLQGSYPALAPTIVDEAGRARIAGDWGDLPAPGETYEFQIVYYQGSPFADPPAGYRSLPSNVFSLTGDMWPGNLEVTVTMQALQVICIWADRDRIGLCTEGLGPSGWDSTGMPTGSCSDYCSGSPEDWGPGVYGGVNVNGNRVFNISYPMWSGARFTFPPAFGYRSPPTITLSLSPFQYLVVESEMWDYDVFYHDDAFCQGLVQISPDELQRIKTGAMPGFHVNDFIGGDGLCYLGYTVEVR
jgi:LysM repeat protein